MAGSTVFLSRLIGVAALILGAAMLAGTTPMLAAITHASEDPASLFLLAIAGVVAGLAIVLTHNLWTSGAWPLVVTLCGWVILARGVLLLVLPSEVIRSVIAAAHVAEYFQLYAALPLVLGAFLSYRGFFTAAATRPAPVKAAPTPTPPPKPAPSGNRRPRRRR